MTFYVKLLLVFVSATGLMVEYFDAPDIPEVEQGLVLSAWASFFTASVMALFWQRIDVPR